MGAKMGLIKKVVIRGSGFVGPLKETSEKKEGEEDGKDEKRE
jgi:hypothetical protein